MSKSDKHKVLQPLSDLQAIFLTHICYNLSKIFSWYPSLLDPILSFICISAQLLKVSKFKSAKIAWTRYRLMCPVRSANFGPDKVAVKVSPLRSVEAFYSEYFIFFLPFVFNSRSCRECTWILWAVKCLNKTLNSMLHLVFKARRETKRLLVTECNFVASQDD